MKFCAMHDKKKHASGKDRAKTMRHANKRGGILFVSYE